MSKRNVEHAMVAGKCTNRMPVPDAKPMGMDILALNAEITMQRDDVREGLRRGLEMLEQSTHKDDKRIKKLMRELAVSLETTILTSLIEADKHHSTITFLESVAVTRYQEDMLAVLENGIVFGMGMAGHLNINGQEAVDQFMRMLKAKEGRDEE